jgi:transcriptional regulator with XRE-family HTH domain
VALPPPGRFDAEKLRQARIALGITQAELAKRIGVDPGVVNSWEVRGARPSVPNLGRVASALGLAVPDLYRSDAGAAAGSVEPLDRHGMNSPFTQGS